ncbi:MAG: ATP-binding protein [Burkholderiales bacterium]
MSIRLPASLRLTVPLILLGFAATLSAVNVLYHVPRAEQAAEDDVRKRLAQEMSRLQSTLDYLLLKGDLETAQREIAVLAHNHDYVLATLTDDEHIVIAATRRAWLGRRIGEVLPDFDTSQALQAINERRGRVTVKVAEGTLLGYAGILMGSRRDELRPSRNGTLFLVYDLNRSRSEARGRVLQHSLYWAGWAAMLALAMWLIFYVLLTRRTARLVRAAEELAAGNLAARSNLRGRDELGRLSRAFDAMALEVANTQHRLREDIAERKRAEEALRISEASYHAIFDATEDAVFVLDIDSVSVIDANLKACAMYGRTREELLQVDPDRLRFGDSRFMHESAKDMIARARGGETQHFEWHLRHVDGSMHWEEVFVKRVSLGGQDRLLALIRDITEKKRAAAELERQREALYQREKLAALGSLLAGVSHELNNPLSVVVARAVMLEERGDPVTQNAAIKIRTAAERCARIVRTFLALARQQQPERGAVAINDVIAAALDMTAYAVRSGGIDVSLDLAHDIPPILADEAQLHQVLLNLIINAQHALQDHPGPRSILITSRHDASDDVIRLTVADSGPGIPPELRTRVFEPYFTTKPTGVGTGVGLAVSFGIVEAHGGSLTLECPDLGGAVFTVVLPVGTVSTTIDGPAPARMTTSGRCAILIVDDEADIRETLADILATKSNQVMTVGSGREALERMARQHFDIILTDIRMPDLDGRGLYQEIERRWPERADRVVFVTGDTLTSTLREFAAASGRPVIEKPFTPSDVRRIVAELVAGNARHVHR